MDRSRHLVSLSIDDSVWFKKARMGFLEVGHIGKVTGMSETPLDIFF